MSLIEDKVIDKIQRRFEKKRRGWRCLYRTGLPQLISGQVYTSTEIRYIMAQCDCDGLQPN